MTIPNAGRISRLRQEIIEARANIRVILQGKLDLLQQFPFERFNQQPITLSEGLSLNDSDADLKALQSASEQLDEAAAFIQRLAQQVPSLRSDPYLQWFIAENARLDEALKGWCAHYNAKVEEYNGLRAHFVGTFFYRFLNMPEMPYWLDQSPLVDAQTPFVKSSSMTDRRSPIESKPEDSSPPANVAADAMASWTPPQSTPSNRGAVHAWLEVVRGSTGSPLVTVYDGLVIGRGRGVDVQLTDISVSRRHAVIRVRDGVCYLQDQGSVNGTYLNRSRITAAALKDGDRIQIGDAEIIFHSK